MDAIYAGINPAINVSSILIIINIIAPVIGNDAIVAIAADMSILVKCFIKIQFGIKLVILFVYL